MNLTRYSVGFGALLIAAGVCGQTAPEPPEVFVDRGACPGECCTYGTWRAIRTIELHEAPTTDSSRVGRVEAGSAVLALDGEVHTKAGKFVVRKKSPPYRPGDVIWVYTYLGEGYYLVWRAGEMVVQEISVRPFRQKPDEWGYYETAPDSEWWVKVKTKDGLEGWTNAPEDFAGTSSCG